MPRASVAGAGRDLALVLFLFVLHLFPLVGALAGRPWGNGMLGYATAVVLVTGRALARELRPRPGVHAGDDAVGGRAR